MQVKQCGCGLRRDCPRCFGRGYYTVMEDKGNGCSAMLAFLVIVPIAVGGLSVMLV